MIGFALVELALSGIDEVAVVISAEKGELVDRLRSPGPFPPEPLLTRLYPRIPIDDRRRRWPRCALFEQPEPRGVIDALSRAIEYLEGEPFALVMPDNIFVGGPPPVAALAAAHHDHHVPVLGIADVTSAAASGIGNCGAVTLEPVAGSLHRVLELADKRPGTFELPPGVCTRRRAVGRSIVPESFARLEERETGPGPAGSELDDVPRFQSLARQGRLLGLVLEGVCFDVGQPLGFRSARRLLEGPTPEPRSL
jgi:UTP--glucose-1-phosphate uridylyltransferase